MVGLQSNINNYQPHLNRQKRNEMMDKTEK